MKHIKAILWDLDGVKYPYDETFQKAAQGMTARMAIDYLGANLEFDQALEMAIASAGKYKATYGFLYKEHGFDRKKIEMRFHDNIDIGFMQLSTDYWSEINKCRDVEHAILTQGRKSWTDRVLRQLKLKEIFDENHITTLEEYAPDEKSTSPRPFLMGLGKLNCMPKDAVIVEDTKKNLIFAKELGMTTVFVRPKAGDIHEDYIDHIFTTPEDFLRDFNNARLEP